MVGPVSASQAAAHTADIRGNLERRGLPIGAYDLMITGHARSRGLVVMTGNLREFNRVEGLRSGTGWSVSHKSRHPELSVRTLKDVRFLSSTLAISWVG